MTDTDDISVIICAYTDARWYELLAAVASVQRQSRPAREIILVIDHNDSLLECARASIAGATVIANSGARGLSGARNAGIAAAQGAIVAFLDDDAAAAPDWLAQLAALYSDPAVLGAGGAIEPCWPARRPGWFPAEFDWVVGCTYTGMPAARTQVRNLIGCNMSFRRELFDTVGGFRTGMGRIGALPLGCEETELCIRARQRWPQRQLIYTPAARVAHQVSVGRATWRYFRARCYAEGISKAQVSRLVGAGDGLAAERSYTLRTLPLGVLRGLRDASVGAQPAGLARAAAIVAGLAITTAGYLVGRTAAWLADHRSPPSQRLLKQEESAT